MAANLVRHGLASQVWSVVLSAKMSKEYLSSIFVG
jgi:hypothetical protein